jgi:hypothetical protein
MPSKAEKVNVVAKRVEAAGFNLASAWLSRSSISLAYLTWFGPLSPVQMPLDGEPQVVARSSLYMSTTLIRPTNSKEPTHRIFGYCHKEQ